MKITLVVDTEDERGIRDSFKIVSHFYKQQVGRPNAGSEVKYTKIPFIKMLRRFAREAKSAEARGEDPASLRFTKQWADLVFGDLRDDI